MNKIKIGILGAGTWGMALARMLCLAGREVTVWSALEGEIDGLSRTGTHPNLPGAVLPPQIVYTKDIERACRDKDVLLFAVASPYVRATARRAAPHLGSTRVIADVAKGMEKDTLLTMSQVLAEEIGDPGVHIVALSGPTHAEEVIRDLPTTIVAACGHAETAAFVQGVFNTGCMRVYTNEDVFGVELCGALKNIIALACGIATGLGCGDNARAALITRGIAEISRLGTAMGCREQTFGGLAGIGDLIVTATSEHSRNRRCGILLGQGVPVEEAARRVGMVVEGLNALPSARCLADKYQVEMPIVDIVQAVVSGRVEATEVIAALMSREPKSELRGSAFQGEGC